MKIKVCGLRDKENIAQVEALGADYMGFIFYGKSPRFVDHIDVEILNMIPPYINKTAVFVDESAKNILALIDKYNFDFIQLHGNETPAFCKALRDEAIVIKAFGVDQKFDFDMLNKYRNKVDLFLFDTKTDVHGGSGKTFDWDILDQYDMDIPFFLSGGLSLENLEEVKNITHPQFYGVDLNSRFETEPGMKNIDELEKAFQMLKNIDNEVRS
jgi:phosphoribosylanthranilate isomerase